MTNFGQEKVVQDVYDLGAADLILKYLVTPAELAEKVKTILAPKHYDIPEGAD